MPSKTFAKQVTTSSPCTTLLLANQSLLQAITLTQAERAKRSERDMDRKSRDERETTDHKHHRHHKSSKEHKHRHHYSDDDDDDDDHQSRRDKLHDHHHHHRHRERERSIDEENDRDSRREREYAIDDEYERDSRREREGSRDRDRKKRKDRELSEERIEDKRIRVSDGSKREKRRFEEDDVKVKKKGDDNEHVDVNGNDNNGRKRDRRRFEDGDVKKEDAGELTSKSGSFRNDGAVESLNVPSRFASETIPANSRTASKVSSISTTNENKRVNITGSHEVTGKSSTDGTPSTAGKSANVSLDALAKAKKALQMQKELAAKLKKIPLLNKGSSSSTAVSPQVASKEEIKASTAAGALLISSITSGMMASPSAIPAAAASAKPVGAIDPAKYEAVKRAQELAAKMGFRQDAEFAPVINFFPGQSPPETEVLQKPAKAPVLRLDALGREIDEQGNVVNISKPSSLSTLKVNINKQRKDAFQIHKPELEVDLEKNPYFDPNMGIDKKKLLRPKRMSFQFVEEGKWSKDAEIIKLKSQFGEAQAKELKAKQAQLAKAKAEPNVNPNLIEVSERVVTKEKQKETISIPEVEWWDVPLLLSGDYADISNEGSVEDKMKIEKITIYVEHPRPIEPPAEPAPPKPQPLKLTKKEQKKLRTQRRLAREKEKQEMIRQGLLEPPKPKVKMSNLMRVLGAEATQDPTKMEKEIRAAAAEREQAHVDRNIARKLTPAERREKKERKLFEDPNTLETIVSVYKINDLSHPQNRFKVDINAQENRLTGCAVISEGFNVVVVEGGSKSIKRYGKLMLRRINWAAKLENEDGDEDEDEEKPPNKCDLVWQGSVAKPSFNRFSVHDCRTEAAARKVLFDAGVGHYWELAANFVDDQM